MFWSQKTQVKMQIRSTNTWGDSSLARSPSTISSLAHMLSFCWTLANEDIKAVAYIGTPQTRSFESSKPSSWLPYPFSHPMDQIICPCSARTPPRRPLSVGSIQQESLPECTTTLCAEACHFVVWRHSVIILIQSIHVTEIVQMRWVDWWGNCGRHTSELTENQVLVIACL